MKKNDFDFSIPNRQSYVAILNILYKNIKVIFRQLFPLVLIIFLGNTENKSNLVILALIGLAIISMIFSIINYFMTWFFIKDNEIVLHTGVLKKSRTSIPFDRIQTINFEQSLVQQLFSVIKVKIDTAGSETQELELYAVERNKAEALRDIILSHKKAKVSQNVVSEEGETMAYTPTVDTILRLYPIDLIKVGLTENHIRSGGLILVFFFWIYQNLEDAGIELEDYSDEIVGFNWTLGIFLFIAIFVTVVAIIISLVNTVIRYYDLKFLRIDKAFKIESGLLTRHETSAQDNKIQFISWSDNLLKRAIGYRDLRLNQAASIALSKKQSIKIPGCKTTQITKVVETLYGKVHTENMTFNSVDSRYFYRFALYIVLGFIAVSSLLLYIGDTEDVVILSLIAAYLLVSRFLAMRKRKYSFDDEHLIILSGKIGNRRDIMPIYKIQGITLKQTPYQRRNDLCSLSIYTAAGGLKIPYIPVKDGKYISEYFIYKSEIDKRQWM